MYGFHSDKLQDTSKTAGSCNKTLLQLLKKYQQRTSNYDAIDIEDAKTNKGYITYLYKYKKFVCFETPRWPQHQMQGDQ